MDAIHARRARRAFDTKPVEKEKIVALIEAMRFSASCNNNQPWRVIVCRDEDSLAKAKMALTRGNAYGILAPLIFIVAARREDDCHVSDNRDYFLFSCGLAVGQMVLRAVELDLIAHPVAGYDPLSHKREFGIPDDYVVITTIMIGYRGTDLTLLSDKQKAQEEIRPERKPIGENFFDGAWGVPYPG